MADTRVQLEVEDWTKRHWLPERYGHRFSKGKLQLSSGGFFNFDAVSEDHKIVANISTSGATTGSGKLGVGKLTKIRADIYFLLLVDAQRKLVVFSEHDMLEFWRQEVRIGRVPSSIEFVHAQIPDNLSIRLQSARKVSSGEVTPSVER